MEPGFATRRCVRAESYLGLHLGVYKHPPVISAPRIIHRRVRNERSKVAGTATDIGFKRPRPVFRIDKFQEIPKALSPRKRSGARGLAQQIRINLFSKFTKYRS